MHSATIKIKLDLHLSTSQVQNLSTNIRFMPFYIHNACMHTHIHTRQQGLKHFILVPDSELKQSGWEHRIISEDRQSRYNVPWSVYKIYNDVSVKHNKLLICFFIVLGQLVSILIESSSGPSKKTDRLFFIKNVSVWDPTAHLNISK